jgi:hypothetical protein
MCRPERVAANAISLVVIRDKSLRCGTALGSKDKIGSHEYPSSQLATLLSGGNDGGSLLAASRHTATPDEPAVLVPINAMLGGMAKRDVAAIKTPTLHGGMMVLMHEPEPEQITFDAFAERVGKGKTQIEQRIYDPLVRIDNDLAVVWAPFEFRVDGKVDHCGTNSFNLVRTGGKWMIASLAAAVRKNYGTEQSSAISHRCARWSWSARHMRGDHGRRLERYLITEAASRLNPR